MNAPMSCSNGSCSDRRRGPVRWALTWLLLALFSVSAWAGGNGGGNSGSGNEPTDGFNASGGGDEVTSLPMLESSGFTLLGDARELRALVLSVQGRGRIEVGWLSRGRAVVTFSGDYMVELDRRILARGNVQALFKGGTPFSGGVAVLRVGSSSPMRLPAERVQLPMSRLAASTIQGRALSLDAYGQRGQHTGIGTSFGLDTVTLVQRSF